MRATLLALFLVTFTVACVAGQMSSHDYTALSAKDALSGTAAKAVSENSNAFLSGAQGPDVTGVVQHELDGYALAPSVGDESHYDPRKHELALNLLDYAGVDPARRAYAIGWISHYINDLHVHQVVNQYGGYYQVDKDHHKELEQLESKHVIAAHGDIETISCVTVRYDRLGPTFADFIFDAYRATYPTKSIYDINKDPQKRAYFNKRFIEAAFLCVGAHMEFWDTATKQAKNGKHNWVSHGVVFPNMPSFEDYDHIINGLEIVDVQAGKDRLTCTVKVNDDKLYGRFLADWERETKLAIVETRAAFKLISAYLDATPAAKPAARAALLAAIPSVNIDQPLPKFDHATAFPGNRAYHNVLYTCDLTPLGDGAQQRVEGQAPLTVGAAHWSGGEDGTAKLTIPVPTGMYPYAFTLKVATATRDDFRVPEYEGRSWARVDGIGGAPATGAVTIGSVIPVTLTLNDHLAKLRGTRRWCVLDENYGRAQAKTAGAVCGADSPFTLFRQSFGKIPGAPDYVRESAAVYENVTVLDEKLVGNTLKVKLQINDPSYLVVGSRKLVCIFVDHLPYSEKDGAEANRRWQVFWDRARPVYDMIEQKAKALTAAQKKAIADKVTAYDVQLLQQGLSDDERKEKVEQYRVTVTTQNGVPLTKPQQTAIDDERLATSIQALKLNDYTAAWTTCKVAPFRIVVNKPAGWETEGDDNEWNGRILKKAVTEKGADGKPVASVDVRMQITTTNHPDVEKLIPKHYPGHEGTPFELGDFVGKRYADGEPPSEFAFGRTEDILLKHGGLYLIIHTSLNARGGTSAIPSVVSLAREIEAIITSVRLVPKV